ncbi:MAG TPA: orotidine-5'-phosphate decarboxylase [Vicinamibacterales bacterium]|nr:orotidine-5'-phosphate decarboxylase [Vicinamibacterales bacterium]
MFAVDVPSIAEAKQIVTELGDSVVFYKLGLEIFMSGGYFELLAWLRERGKRIFADLKFFDVPQTVGSAVQQLRGRGASFVTVHGGNDAILEAAVAAAVQDGAPEPLRVLAVTVLTSFDQRDVDAMGIQSNVSDVVLSRAKRAMKAGCGGVIASGLEVSRLRQECGDNLILVVPGIRPAADRPADDQKRTVDVETAFRSGADYIVVGRPIKSAPDRRAAAESIQTTIADVFGRSARL